MTDIVVSLREFQQVDRNAIIDSFVKSNRSKGLNLLMDNDIYFKHYDKKIKSILRSDKTKITIAAFSENPDIVMAYLIYELVEDKKIYVHYIYTKYVYRKSGIAKMVFNSVVKPDFKVYTSIIPYNASELKKIKSKKPLKFAGREIIYVPYKEYV